MDDRTASAHLMRPTMPKSMKATRPSGSTNRLPACTSAGVGRGAGGGRCWSAGRWQGVGALGRASTARETRWLAARPFCAARQAACHRRRSLLCCAGRGVCAPAWKVSQPTTEPNQVLRALISTDSGSTAHRGGRQGNGGGEWWGGRRGRPSGQDQPAARPGGGKRRLPAPRGARNPPLVMLRMAFRSVRGTPHSRSMVITLRGRQGGSRGGRGLSVGCGGVGVGGGGGGVSVCVCGWWVVGGWGGGGRLALAGRLTKRLGLHRCLSTCCISSRHSRHTCPRSAHLSAEAQSTHMPASQPAINQSPGPPTHPTPRTPHPPPTPHTHRCVENWRYTEGQVATRRSPPRSR